jgi:hypothetical protein
MNVSAVGGARLDLVNACVRRRDDGVLSHPLNSTIMHRKWDSYLGSSAAAQPSKRRLESRVCLRDRYTRVNTINPILGVLTSKGLLIKPKKTDTKKSGSATPGFPASAFKIRMQPHNFPGAPSKAYSTPQSSPHAH